MRVLVTGGSGFVASHCIACLLRVGYEVVCTVRSNDKGEQVLREQLPYTSSEGQLSYVIVADIVRDDAFDVAMKSHGPFESVIHMASPFHFNVTDPQKDLLDPAIKGTTGILNSINRCAPSVKRVVITSSFVAIHDVWQQQKRCYSESDWNSITWEQALENPGNAYRGSKKFAEEAAWKFIAQQRPTFDLVAINPPLIFGPILQQLTSLDAINTSNERIRSIIQGKWKQTGIPPTGVFLWVDVRDVALAHLKALRKSAAGNRRFLVAAGHYSNSELVGIVRSAFHDLSDQLPHDCRSDMPEDVYDYDNSKSRDILGLRYITLENSIIDTVQSLLGITGQAAQ